MSRNAKILTIVLLVIMIMITALMLNKNAYVKENFPKTKEEVLEKVKKSRNIKDVEESIIYAVDKKIITEEEAEIIYNDASVFEIMQREIRRRCKLIII